MSLRLTSSLRPSQVSVVTKRWQLRPQPEEVLAPEQELELRGLDPGPRRGEAEVDLDQVPPDGLQSSALSASSEPLFAIARSASARSMSRRSARRCASYAE